MSVNENRLFVGNLDYQVREQEVEELFRQAGEISKISLITDRDTGRSKGFAFVEMADVEAASKAIEMFDGNDFHGRRMAVSVARPREESDRNRGGDRGGYRQGRSDRDYRSERRSSNT
jgi:cold-inducible RNA-binding protein